MTIAVTRAAEGWDRVRFSAEAYKRLSDAGLFDEDDKIELIGGEFVPMAPKKNMHEIAKNDLGAFFVRALGPEVRVAFESTLWLDDAHVLEPDIAIYPKALKPEDVRGPDLLLLIEIADTSLKRDAHLKAAIYAAAGVRDYWIVEPEARRLTIHRGPRADGGWASVAALSGQDEAAPLLLAPLKLRLAQAF